LLETAEVKKQHILSMFDRIEKFREHAPSVPEEQVMSYLTELENFLGSSCYAKTLGQIKP
jgi:hypothetical protein